MLEKPLAVPHDATTWDAVQLMVENGAKHAVVFNRGAEQHIENVIASSRICQMVAAGFEGLTIKSMPIGDFTSISDNLNKPTITVFEDATVLSAFEAMVKNKVTAVPVVDASHKVTGMISLSDIKTLGSSLEFFRALGDDVVSYQKLVDNSRGFAPGRTPRPHAVVCVKEDPLIDVLELFNFFKVHHVAVIDNDGKPLGVISTFDVMKFVFEACKNDSE